MDWVGAWEVKGPPTYKFWIEGDVSLLNAERAQSHWSGRAAATKQWRAWSKERAEELEIPRLTNISVAAIHNRRTKRKVDTGSAMPTVKAVIDGLVDAGVIEHDGPDIVKALLFTAPVISGWEGLEIYIMTDAYFDISAMRSRGGEL